jgi:DNA repair protein RecN (Recombination protein N)
VTSGMLCNLSIQNIILIDQLELEVKNGLSVLTGETGAGKSILLDALGLVLGSRAEQGLVREGCEQGSVTAAFAVTENSPLKVLLEDRGVDLEGNELILRRTVKAQGNSRAFINDQPVSIGLLREVGDNLVEVHGQHGQQGLMDTKSHRSLLDTHGGLVAQAGNVSHAYEAWQGTVKALAKMEQEIAAAQADEDYLRHALQELESLAPVPGEEEELSQARTLMMHGEQVADELSQAVSGLTASKGAENSVRVALRRIERITDKAAGKLDPVANALAKAYEELTEAITVLEVAQRDLDFDPQRLEGTEERLFALRASARKYQCQVDGLGDVLIDMRNQIGALETGEAGLIELRQQCAQAEEKFIQVAEAQSAARRKAAKAFDASVNAELPSLKLEKATFQTTITAQPQEQWSRNGADYIAFEVSTNPGAAMGALSKIASGGELSRFSLALKVVLAKGGAVPTMIFDEIDQGIGGAVADAVGERLARLADDAQILVVTHSPQVASRGAHHMRVGKEVESDITFTRVDPLEGNERLEEVARMLAGAHITDEARAAAKQLIDNGVAL